MKFRELYEILESVSEINFAININGSKYYITRDWHLLQNRNGDIKQKDFAMTISRYKTIFKIFFGSNHNLNLTKPISVTWNDLKDNKSNIISFELNGQNIKIFGAIMNSSKSHEKLYPRFTNRLYLGVL